MTTPTGEIRIVHAGDLSTRDAFKLTWLVGDRSLRLQEIAICDGRVVGSWQYGVEAKGRNWWIDSAYTEVAKRFQRRGLAVRLWHHGIARWRPSRIKASIGTPAGMMFLARMIAELEYSNPSLFLEVKVPPDDHESWTYQKEHAAREKLRELGKAAAASAPKPKPKQLAAGPSLVKAAG